MLDSCFMKEVHTELKASLRCSLTKYLLNLGLVQNRPLTLSVGQESWSFYILKENHSSTYSQIRTEVCFQKLKISAFLAYRWWKRPTWWLTDNCLMTTWWPPDDKNSFFELVTRINARDFHFTRSKKTPSSPCIQEVWECRNLGY